MMATPAGKRDEPFELRCEALGALPIVCHLLERIRLDELLRGHLPEANARATLCCARTIGALVRNLCLARAPLYGLGEWARPFCPALLGLAREQAEQLNDDRVGRALDALFEADRASLLCELVLGAVSEFAVETSQLHNDSTSITLHGAYAGGRANELRARAPLPARGHSKDHRPDLKQLVVILTVAADGALPLAHRLCDGNTNDAATHVDSWDGLCALLGRADFLYVADSKLATREQMAHIDAGGGRFVCVMPRSRKEARRLREWTRAARPSTSEAARRPGRRKGEPDEVWSVVRAPIDSAEGYRIVWVHSSKKQALDESARADSIARGVAALEALAKRLEGRRCRFWERDAVVSAARSALRAKGVEALLRLEVTERLEVRRRRESAGPGRPTREREVKRLRFTLSWELDEQAIAREAACDGYFPLISNDRELSEAELLRAYRRQPKLEKRHHELKGVLDAAPVYLKTPARIEALFACHFVALLVHALLERELRRAMANEGIERLALYPEQRACAAPTAARVFELFAGVQRHRLLSDGELVQVFEPALDAQQRQLLELLGIPLTAYTCTDLACSQ